MTVIPGEEQAVPGGKKGNVTPYDQSFRRNPGTRIRLMPLDGYTQPGLIDDGLVLPAPPLNQLQRDLQNNWADYDTVSAGQFSRPSGMQLQTISIDSIIVADDYPWVFYNPMRQRGWTADDFVRQLGKILRSSTPFWLYLENVEYKPDSAGTGLVVQRDGSGGITQVSQSTAAVSYDFGPTPLLKMMATMRQLTPTIQPGEPEARYITMAFTEHRIPGLTEKKLGKNGTGTGQGTKGSSSSRTLPAFIGLAVFQGAGGGIAQDQHTLQDLAVTYYGSAAKWTTILAANSWLGSITATHDLGDWNTAELKAAGKANRQLKIPTLTS